MEVESERIVVTMTKAELADFARAVAKEVLTRLDAAERLQSENLQITTGALCVNLPAHEVTVDGSPVRLKTREFALLAALAQNLGRVLAREQLLEAAWPDPQAVVEAAVPVALAQAAGDFAPELRARIANRVFAETKIRYVALAGATLMTIDAREHG